MSSSLLSFLSLCLHCCFSFIVATSFAVSMASTRNARKQRYTWRYLYRLCSRFRLCLLFAVCRRSIVCKSCSDLEKEDKQKESKRGKERNKFINHLKKRRRTLRLNMWPIIVKERNDCNVFSSVLRLPSSIFHLPFCRYPSC